MGKIKFVSNEGNFTAKGYVLNEVYETGNRTESGKNPGKFYYFVSGKGLVGSNEWETNLFLYFQFPKNSEEAIQAHAYLAILKGTPASATQTVAVTQVTPGVQPPVQTAPVLQQSPVGIPIGPVAVQEKLDTAKPADHKWEHDILLAGLSQLDFGVLNLKILKIEGKLSMTVVMDWMPPLTINARDISASSVLEQIVSTFSENALIVSTISQWRKELSELQAKLGEEIAVTKVKVEAKAKRVAKVKEESVVETAIPNEPVEVEIAAGPGPEPTFMDDTLDMPPIESAPEDPEPVAELSTVDEGNGLDSDVDEFQLK